MSKITTIPEFYPGQVIDLSYKTNNMPNRILIRAVYREEQHKEWMYKAITETNSNNDDDVAIFAESFIKERRTNHSYPVYKSNIIKQRIKDGFRFCGNYQLYEARARGENLKSDKRIEKIIMYPALDYRGVLIPDQAGLWVKYTTVITDNGNVDNQSDNDAITIIK